MASKQLPATAAAFHLGSPHLSFSFSNFEASTRVWAGSVRCGWVQAGPGHIAFSDQLRPVAPQTQGRAKRWPVWFPTPFWMRLGRGAGGVARAPKDARASCSSWPQLSERSCSSEVGSAAHPASAPTQVAPQRSEGVAASRVAFLLSPFLWRSKEKDFGRRAETRPLPSAKLTQHQKR